MKDLPELSKLSDQDLKRILKENQIGLTVNEAREVEKVLGRPPTLTEAILWGIQGSEHCSYKSSRRYLKLLPSKAPNVILGPGEDAGVIEITRVNLKSRGRPQKAVVDRYGLVVSHESHNHPSQIVPFEGAATGVGGCVRDVACMGARVIGVMDPLRFGNLKKNEARQIANGVVAGIGGYGNPIGVPNLGGDVYFDNNYNENCLVNVVAFGLVKESEVIHSFVPKNAAKEKWDIIIVGKPTDISGMGGAAFASVILDEAQKEKNKGAVQEPNPFLKRHLLVASYDLFHLLKKKGLLKKVSFKDMGAGGISCSTVEQVAKNNLGAKIDLGKVNVAMEDLSASVIACAETQERFTWMCHPDLTPMILDHYNTKWDLPSVAENARAALIGKVTKGHYVLTYRGEVYVDAPSRLITAALQYNRPSAVPKKKLQEPKLGELQNYGRVLLDLLGSENIACRKPLYECYDKQVQGYVVIEAGEADASVIVPLMDEKVSPALKKIGIAFSTDGNPRYGLISPYHGATNAVVEAMRNVAAVGAYPQAITDCLNYGNPEKKDQLWELKEGIRGIAAACEGIKLWNHRKYATPVISGNVSLYNESKNCHIPPSAIICCIGKIDDAGKAITPQLKKAGHKLYLLGGRKNELGGSEFYRLHGELGANVPRANFAQAQKEIYTMVEAVARETVTSAHDISEGGLAVTVAEMAFGGRGEPLQESGKKTGDFIGAEIDLEAIPLADGKDKNAHIYRRRGYANVVKLFSETGGFVLEVAHPKEKKFLQICKKNKLEVYEIGVTTRAPKLIFKNGAKILVNLPVKKAAEKWLNGLRKKL